VKSKFFLTLPTNTFSELEMQLPSGLRRTVSELVAAILLVFIVAAAGSIVYYAFTYKYSQMRAGMRYEERSLEDTVLESESLTIVYALLNASESPTSPPLYLVLGTGLKPPVIGAIYINGSMVYNGTLKLPPTSTILLKIPTHLKVSGRGIADITVASVSGVKYHASGYVG